MGLSSRLNQRRFRRGPLASSTGHDWLRALAGCCPSPVIGKAVFARFVGGATSNGLHAEAIVHILTRSDTLVFSGSQTCGILLFRTRTESSFGEQKVKDSDRDSYVSLCECACCGLKRIPIHPRMEQDIFMLFAAAERDDTHSKKPSPL